MTSRFAVLSLTLALAPPAGAALIEVDLFTAGDGLLTRDTATGLEWLDLTATTGRSYQQVLADVGGWRSLGFRHATGTEVCAFFAAHAFAPGPSCPNGSSMLPGNQVSTLHTLLGVTNPSIYSPSTHGMYDDAGGGPEAGRAALTYLGTTFMSASAVLDDNLAPDLAFTTVGHFLVIPEPSSAVLLAAAVFALGALRKRRSPRP